MTFDLAGNRTQIDDISAGEIDFEFDALGQLEEVIDDKGQKTTYDHDKLGRLIERKDCVGGCSPSVTNTWDWDATNATG